MSLTQDLANLTDQMQSMFPENVKSVMMQTAQDLLNSGIADQALRVGEKIPHFVLPNAVNQLIDSQDLLNSGPVVISFYRGGWCPYCNLELRALQAILPQIQTYGATLIAISPETPDHSLSTVEKNELLFEVLSDVGNQVARQFGLVYTLPEIIRPIYHNFGIDLPSFNGDQSFELPIPATYIVNREGVILYGFVDPDYTQRQDPEGILTILQSLIFPER